MKQTICGADGIFAEHRSDFGKLISIDSFLKSFKRSTREVKRRGISQRFLKRSGMDPERERYFVEVRFPDGSRKKKRFRRQREAQRWWSLQIAKIEEGTWNQLIPKNVTLAAAFDEYRKYSHRH